MLPVISLMIPVYNEQECLELLYNKLRDVLSSIEYDYEILFINDGSKDDSLKIIKDLCKFDSHIAYVNLSRNYGKEIAMAAGFDYVKGDAVIILDADLQDPPYLIPELIRYWEQGFDDVYCKRRSRAGETYFKKKSSEIFYKVLQKLTRVNILPDTGDFRLLSKRAVNALRQYRECRRYTKGFFSLIGFKKKEILFDRDPRAAGTTKWNYYHLMNLAIEGITSFTCVPLRISTILGLCTAFAGFTYMMFTIIKTLAFGNEVPGYSSIIAIILFFSGVQLISLGILGEYLGRVFDETKSRPLYFIDEYKGKDI